jgi:hypothetical protein
MSESIATTTPHIQFSKYKGKLQLEFHADPNKNPDIANRFTRKTVGAAMGKTVARAIQTNGAATVFKAIAIVAAASVTEAEGEAIMAEVNKLVKKAGDAADKLAASPVEQAA